MLRGRAGILSLVFLLAAACSTLTNKPYAGLGRETVSAEVVAKYAPPPLPPDTEKLVGTFFGITEPTGGVIAPDGKTLFFTWSVSGTRQVWRVNGPSNSPGQSFPVQITSGSDPTSIFGITPPEGRYLILSRDHAGEENPGLYLMPSEGGELIEIQHKKGVRTIPVSASADGDTIFYMANDRRSDSFALYAYSVSERTKTLLFAEPGSWFVADVQGDTRFLLGRRTGARTREFFVFSTETEKLEPVIGQSEMEEYSASFAYDFQSFFILTSKGRDFRRLYVLRDGKLSPVTPDVNKEIESFSIDHRHAKLYLEWNEEGRSRTEARDSQSLKTLEIPALKFFDDVSLVDLTRFGRYAVFAAEKGGEPRSLYVYDWSSKALTRWTQPSVPEISRAQLRKATLEAFPARDGSRIPMWVTRPAKCAVQPCPVIVDFHGGPESQSRPTFNRIAQTFTAAGFVFVQPNVRGSSGYGRAYRDADNGPKRLDVITDIEDCSKHLKATWAVNGVAPKIGVMGRSYGGYATLMAMTRFAGAYDAGVSVVGISDLVSFLKNTAAYRTRLRTSEYGDPEKDRETLKRLSPITYVSQAKDPILIMQGVNDPRVPVGEAIQMHDALVEKGVDSPLILFAEEGHGSARRENLVLEIGHALKFFQERLLTSKASAPGPKS